MKKLLHKSDVDELNGRINACMNCDLWFVRKNVVAGAGPIDADIVIIGEAPGFNEQNSINGIPFIGRAGKILDEILQEAGISRGDCFVTNTLKCWPGEGNPDPTPEQIAACDPWLDMQLDIIRPRGIITFGRFSTNKFIEFPKGRGIGAVKGWMRKLHWEGGKPCYVMPVYHPAYIGRSPDEKGPTIKLLERFQEVVMDDDNFAQFA